MKPSIHSLAHQTMQEWVLEQGEKKFRADQIWEWLYRKRVQSFEEMTNLSKDLIAKLNDQFVVNPLKQRIVQESADEGVQVNLAVSLHAPNNELRSSIMKINRAFPIEKLFAAIEYYIETTNRRVTFEYIMLNEVNDGVEQALELAELLKNIKKLSYVNLIPYNPVSEHDQYSRSPKERVLAFYDTLKKKGVNCVVRQEHGTDIDAACGQLRSNTMKRDRQKAVAAVNP
ncbi:TPA: hypothetical protein ACKA6U_000009 [Streptococcus pneumoniae]|nr:radical SAM enzyme, Cfr family [Streptococcus pneumoniae]